MAAADVFAFPSLTEGFGLAAMEALAAGVPLVVRDLPVLREVFGPAARFADTPEALATTLAHALTSDDPVRAALQGADRPPHLDRGGRTPPGVLPVGYRWVTP
ncbi:glycosyltransferase [Streptomyces mirabilis]|uniref:glycosyltransferase n=1 Tax=Streptomyces mirabilis TaxID=68239 RepID=UPI003674F31A